MTHEIKLDVHYADAVLSGDKCFEVRLNDRGYQKGDRVVFRPVDKGMYAQHPVANEVYEITYLVHGYGLEPGWCAFGIRRLHGEV